ncbi:MAG TPA: TetR/AcrR family transcriptional regulator [Rhizomicrobium sp.]|nr:TetR/AcrR family transcriptional regulator [Rhizomicrobium sp.]
MVTEKEKRGGLVCGRQDRICDIVKCESGDMKEQIITAAKRVFLREGYGASIDAIVAEAGIARQTLYNHFAGKKELFLAVMEEVVDRTMHPLLHIETDAPLREMLTRFARHYIEGALDPDSLALSRMISSAVKEFPEIGPLAYSAGPRRTIPALAYYLRAQMEAGHIVLRDPEIIAESFFGAVIGHARYRYIFGLGIDHNDRRRAAFIEQVVEVYMHGLQSGLNSTTG